MLPGLKLVSHWTEPESLETVSEWDNVILSWAPERLVYHNIQYTYSTYCSTCIPWMISIALHMSHVHTPERPVYHNIQYMCSTYCSTAHVTCIPWTIPITLHMLHVHTPYTREAGIP